MKFLFFGTAGCHSVLSIAGIIEGSRCHSWSEQYLFSSSEIIVLRSYWEFRAVIWTQIRTRVLFLLAETSGCHSVLSIAGIIEGSRCHSWSEQYLLFSFENPVLRDYWGFRAVIWTEIRTRMWFLLSGNLRCRSVLSIAEIIEGSRCHSWRDGRETSTTSVESSSITFGFLTPFAT